MSGDPQFDSWLRYTSPPYTDAPPHRRQIGRKCQHADASPIPASIDLNAGITSRMMRQRPCEKLLQEPGGKHPQVIFRPKMANSAFWAVCCVKPLPFTQQTGDLTPGIKTWCNAACLTIGIECSPRIYWIIT